MYFKRIIAYLFERKNDYFILKFTNHISESISSKQKQIIKNQTSQQNKEDFLNAIDNLVKLLPENKKFYTITHTKIINNLNNKGIKVIKKIYLGKYPLIYEKTSIGNKANLKDFQAFYYITIVR